MSASILQRPGKIVLGQPEYPHDSFTLFIAGDVMTGRGIDQILPYSVEPVLYEQYMKSARQYVGLAKRHSGAIPDDSSFDYLWGDALQVLKRVNPDIRIINLETSITTSEDYWQGKAIHYRMHPGNTPLFTEAGIDVCVLGNNHILDWGYDGLAETLESLKKRGLLTAGAGRDADSASEPAVIETKNGRLLVFSYADTSAGIPVSWKAGEEKAGVNLLNGLGQDGIKQVKSDVESYRRTGDLVVLSIHWGGNWGYHVPVQQQEFAHRLIDAGAADVIHGHSSHHPKGIEVYRDRLILYGCGDLINDYEGISGHEEYRGELTLLYFPGLAPTGKLLSLVLVPMEIKRFRLNAPDEQDQLWIGDRLKRECRKFGTSIEYGEGGYLNLGW